LPVTKKTNDEAATRFWTKINLVAEITELISNSPSDQDTFRATLEKIKEVVPFDFATFYLFFEDSGELRDIVTIGEKVEPLDFVPFELGFGFTAWAAKQRQPVKLAGLKNPDREKPVGSFLVMPLMVEGKLLGVISFGSEKKENFRDQDIKLLGILANQIAVSADRMIYQRRLEKQNDSLKRVQKQLLLAQERLIGDERLDAVRELSVSVNHEINNPLSVIVGNIQCLLFIEKNLAENVVERLRRIEHEALRIADINRKLLDIDNLVSETYINSGEKIRMINIEKSTSGANKK